MTFICSVAVVAWPFSDFLCILFFLFLNLSILRTSPNFSLGNFFSVVLSSLLPRQWRHFYNIFCYLKKSTNLLYFQHQFHIYSHKIMRTFREKKNDQWKWCQKMSFTDETKVTDMTTESSIPLRLLISTSKQYLRASVYVLHYIYVAKTSV